MVGRPNEGVVVGRGNYPHPLQAARSLGSLTYDFPRVIIPAPIIYRTFLFIPPSRNYPNLVSLLPAPTRP